MLNITFGRRMVGAFTPRATPSAVAKWGGAPSGGGGVQGGYRRGWGWWPGLMALYLPTLN